MLILITIACWHQMFGWKFSASSLRIKNNKDNNIHLKLSLTTIQQQHLPCCYKDSNIILTFQITQ